MGDDGSARWGAGRVAGLVVLLLVVITVVVDALTARVTITLLERGLEVVRDAGAFGPFLFAAIYVLATVCFVPGSVLTLGAGFIFSEAYGQGLGILVAFSCVWLGASVGATLAFLLGRSLLRGWVVSRLLARYPIVRSIDAALGAQGARIMTLLRLSPIVPFNAFNYIASMTAVSLRHYVVAHVGMVPGTLAFVYFGSLLSGIKEAAGGPSQRSDRDRAIQLSLLAAGGVATVVAAVLTTCYARKELRNAGLARSVVSPSQPTAAALPMGATGHAVEEPAAKPPGEETS